MTPDDELYKIMCTGLGNTEDRMKTLGVPHWKVAMVTYDPANPKAYMVIGSAGEEAVQSKIATIINPADADRPPDFVATPTSLRPATREALAFMMRYHLGLASDARRMAEKLEKMGGDFLARAPAQRDRVKEHEEKAAMFGAELTPDAAPNSEEES